MTGAASCRLRLVPDLLAWANGHTGAKVPKCAAHRRSNGVSDMSSSNGNAAGDKKTIIKTKPRIENNRVLVTGGAGFVGSHLCTFLVEKGDHVRSGCAGSTSAAYLPTLCCMRACQVCRTRDQDSRCPSWSRALAYILPHMWGPLVHFCGHQVGLPVPARI